MGRRLKPLFKHRAVGYVSVLRKLLIAWMGSRLNEIVTGKLYFQGVPLLIPYLDAAHSARLPEPQTFVHMTGRSVMGIDTQCYDR